MVFASIAAMDDDTSTSPLVEARQWLKVIQSALPTSVEAGGLHTRSKMPFKVLCCRAGLIWRIEELGRCALDAHEKGDVIAAMLLARSLTETACALWYLKELIERQLAEGAQPDLDDVLMRLLMGHKGDPGFPEAVNVLTFINKADKRFSGILEAYNHMSESAHPNFWGSSGAFSAVDEEKLVTQFGRGIRKTSRFQILMTKALIGSLSMTHAAYNSVADMMPAFIERCEETLDKQSEGD
jgi:hypothetical protein